jgi:hypothetical protein
MASWLTPAWALLIGGTLIAFTALLLAKTIDEDPGRRCDNWGLPQLALAGEPDRVDEILACVGSGTPEAEAPESGFVADARSALRWDNMLVVAYGAAFAFWCTYGALRARTRPARRCAAGLAGMAVLAAAYDGVENWLVDNELLTGSPSSAAIDWTYAAALARWVLVVPVALFALAMLFLTFSRVARGVLSASTWPGFLGTVPDLPAPPAPVAEGQPPDRFAVPSGVEGRVTEGTDAAAGGAADDADDVGDLGICLSGGGIRAASFALGALQALATSGHYGKARYLATVSGGGYLGGASQFVAQGNDRFGTIDGRAPFAAAVPADPPPQPRRPPAAAPEVELVRRRARFLWWPATAGQRWRSTQMFASAIGAALLGIAFNITLLATLVFVMARPVGWGVRTLFTDPDEGVVDRTAHGAWFTLITLLPLIVLVAAFLWQWLVRLRLRPLARVFVLVVAIVGGSLVPGFISHYAVGPEVWWDGWPGWVTAAVLLATPIALALLVEPQEKKLSFRVLLPAAGWVLAEIVLVVFFVWFDEAAAEGPRGEVSWRPVFIVGVALGSLLLFVVLAAGLRLILSYLPSDQVPRRRLLAAVLLALAGVTGAIVAIGMLLWTDAADRLTDDWIVWLVVTGLVGFVYTTFDQKWWSPHPLYKSRLAGTFSPIRRGNPPSGAQALPYGIRTHLSSWARRVDGSPQLLVCAAAYSTRGVQDGLPAYPFTFSYDYVGGAEVGWMRTIDFEAALGRSNAADGTLLAAMAVSGAAVSPALGQVNLGSVSAAIAVINGRLGVWLPNPRYVNELREVDEVRSGMAPAGGPRPWRSAEGPALRWLRLRRFTYLLKEIAGIHDLDDRFVYVTDGGQFDNLGLLELLARRCRRVVAVDASGDGLLGTGTFQGVRAVAERRYGITFTPEGADIAGEGATDPKALTARLTTMDPEAATDEALEGRFAEDCIAVMTIHYPATARLPATTGKLVLAKAVLSRFAPDEVKQFAATSAGATFPRDSTADQFIDDIQFDNYRLLGQQVATRAAASL